MKFWLLKTIEKIIDCFWPPAPVVHPPIPQQKAATPKPRPAWKKKEKLKRCLHKGKFCYTREQAVYQRDRLRPTTANGFLRIYCCEFCGTWHLTHQRGYNN